MLLPLEDVQAVGVVINALIGCISQIDDRASRRRRAVSATQLTAAAVVAANILVVVLILGGVPEGELARGTVQGRYCTR